VKGAQYTFDWDSKTSGALVKDLRVGEDGTSLELSITDKGKIVYQDARKAPSFRAGMDSAAGQAGTKSIRA
jgi:hypothetical protein